MRGHTYFQTAELTKVIFKEGVKKDDRVNPNHLYFGCVSSYKTMETYRNVWNNLGNYLREHWSIKDFERITIDHVEAYFEYKIEYYPTKQYLEKLSSAIGKLELALTRYSKLNQEYPKVYNFEIRQQSLNNARKLNQVSNGYKNRVYLNPLLIIENLQDNNHKLAATIQLEGGARSEAVSLIKKEQLIGTKVDKITQQKVGVIFTKEKGGKEGDVLVSIKAYKLLEDYFLDNQLFRVKYQSYANDIRDTCKRLNIDPKGSHGFRWTFAQTRIRAYQDMGYSYEQALQGVSIEMKHHRASISEHYLGGS